jgi:hypothetical protein
VPSRTGLTTYNSQGTKSNNPVRIRVVQQKTGGDTQAQMFRLTHDVRLGGPRLDV